MHSIDFVEEAENLFSFFWDFDYIQIFLRSVLLTGRDKGEVSAILPSFNCLQFNFIYYNLLKFSFTHSNDKIKKSLSCLWMFSMYCQSWLRWFFFYNTEEDVFSRHLCQRNERNWNILMILHYEFFVMFCFLLVYELSYRDTKSNCNPTSKFSPVPREHGSSQSLSFWHD